MQEPVKSTALHNPSGPVHTTALVSPVITSCTPSIGVPSDDVILPDLDMKHLEDLIRN